jgi:hypothetical protein
MATTSQPAMTRLDEARCEALFASGLQPSDAPAGGMVAAAIIRACECKRYTDGTQPHSRYCSVRGCAGRMAQEFGDHPEAAARRMRQLVQAAAWLMAALRARAGKTDTKRCAINMVRREVGTWPAENRQVANDERDV